MKKFLLLLFFLSGCADRVKLPEDMAHIEEPDTSVIQVKFPKDKDIEFFGSMKNNIKNEQSGSMTYPGSNGGIFLASIMAHALIENGIQKKEKKKKRKESDLILRSYQAAIDQISKNVITPRSISLRKREEPINLELDKNNNSRNHWIADVAPVFYLGEAGETIKLQNRISFKQSSQPDKVEEQVVVIYVSNPYEGDSPVEYWTADNGDKLSSVAQKAFSTTMKLALESLLGPIAEGANKTGTIRYVENGEKKIERGTVLYKECNRTIFKTLRGAIKSVPDFMVSSDCNQA